MMADRLCPYAVTAGVSKGRTVAEQPHRYRTDFERDRDRIIHCSAFRRLEGKTQVFTPGLDDYYRTRLTHSIEVAQLGRTVAKALGLNESLTEAICLAHDLGHPPFGHAGEEVLNRLMADHGGFEHNAQTLRIVDLLEHPYPAFVGLNLMYETRLGLARHKSPYDAPKEDGFGELNCTLEGQVANVADRIAYNCHDLEDGMRARLLTSDQMQPMAIYVEAAQRVGIEQADCGRGVLRYGQEKVPIKRNDFVYLPVGVEHGISNQSQEPLCLLVMGFKIPEGTEVPPTPKRMMAHADDVRLQVQASHGPSTQFKLLMGTTQTKRDKLAAAQQINSLFLMDFAPGGTNIPHRHNQEEEIYYVLRGHGDMVAGSDAAGKEMRYSSRRGDAFYFVRGTLIGFYSGMEEGEEHAQILAVRWPVPSAKSEVSPNDSDKKRGDVP